MLRKPYFWIATIAVLVLAGYYYQLSAPLANQKFPAEPTRIQCILGGPDPFWNDVLEGAKDAAEEFNAELETVTPESSETAVSEQTAALRHVDPKKIDALMISPLDPTNQTRLISAAAAAVGVATFDNRAPDALTHYHIGANNHNGGRLLAELVQRALPDGGEIALFVGDNSRETARIRRQLLINTLADRESFTSVSDELDAPIEAGKYTIVETYLDQRDDDRALENATDALQNHPEVQCLVGLYSRNGPACAQAVDEAGKTGDVQVVAFDHLDATLQGIRNGKIIGSVVQKPYLYGYESVRLLCLLHHDKAYAVPQGYSGTLTVACQIVDSDNVDDYREQQPSTLAE
ncbi:substrate-binding domain-containing protein [Adhaeretor mobilis]|uniref:D-allose-binding periplasmic protein n=1 Tax=Adhaeretor mobilis TaxID=1930276 RepID=A0A517N1A6_9BACT|nr:substrate-binding domain-containing protein [Adhaeretor mobilis]QDT00907.1 D-allose-binding periplasmic protein precursor [Adhaeretor mobilis]